MSADEVPSQQRWAGGIALMRVAHLLGNLNPAE